MGLELDGAGVALGALDVARMGAPEATRRLPVTDQTAKQISPPVSRTSLKESTTMRGPIRRKSAKRNSVPTR